MKFLDILLVILVTIAWGVNFVAAKWALEGFSPIFANGLRFAAVVIMLWPFLRIIPGRMADLAIAAVALGVIHFGAVFWAVKLSDGVGSVAIASQLNVPFSTLLAIFLLGETVGWKRAAGIALSFVGVLALGLDPTVFTYWEGLLVMTFAALMYSVSAILMRRLKDVRAVTTQAWVGVAGVIGSLLLSFAFESGQLEMVEAAPTSAWLAVLYSGIGSSVIGHGGANYLLRKYEVSVVSPYFLLTPVVGVLAGVIMLNEAFTWRMALGGALTLAGVLVVTLRNNARSARLAEVAEDRAAV
ncbi:DMT family transporter [Kordiimonas aestuarii]|uniref:DMT family transporter n=1 Tax=Kordiimonas aestuarii TaxID=1005925 RepID=UPI0021D2BC8A|nr:DMT family transporter [Kordiimonas aestuarii]